jgi:hypothetical protein
MPGPATLEPQSQAKMNETRSPHVHALLSMGGAGVCVDVLVFCGWVNVLVRRSTALSVDTASLSDLRLPFRPRRPLFTLSALIHTSSVFL